MQRFLVLWLSMCGTLEALWRKRFSARVEYPLACFYEMNNGRKAVEVRWTFARNLNIKCEIVGMKLSRIHHIQNALPLEVECAFVGTSGILGSENVWKLFKNYACKAISELWNTFHLRFVMSWICIQRALIKCIGGMIHYGEVLC